MKLHGKAMLRIACALICALMVFASAPNTTATVYAETPAEKLDRIEKELQEKENEIAANKKDEKKQTQIKNSYAQKAELERQKLEQLAAQIQEQQDALHVKQEEIALKVAQLDETRRLYENRLVATYKKKERSSIAALLSVTDFGSLLRSAKNLQRIAKADNDLMDLLGQQQAELEVMRADIETRITELNTLRAQAEDTKASYEYSMQQAQLAANEANAKKQANEAAYDDLLPLYEQALAEWQQWVSEEIQGGEFVGGEFMWPVPNYYKVSSGFGVVRYIYGKKDIHRGIDIPAPSGTPIYAAAEGTASVGGHHYTYGNCIKISHGGGVVSVYAHMLSYAPGIKSGDRVRKGQLIGYVGSTGNSTGNHLHFEIDANGVPTNPYNYLAG